MKILKLPIKLGLSLIILFAFFTFLVHESLFQELDLITTLKIQSTIPRVFDIWFSLFSLIGSLEIITIILLILWFAYRKPKFIYVLLCFGFFHIMEIIGKIFVTHPSPPVKFFRYDIPFLFPSSSVQTGSSYPSGHMGRTMFISIILTIFIAKSKKLSRVQKSILYILIVIFDFLMFISRIYLGEHWFSDLVGGGILGSAFALISLSFL